MHTLKKFEQFLIIGSIIFLIICFPSFALASKIEITTGDPIRTNVGTPDYTFTLVAPDGTEQKFEVKDIAASDNAKQKAIKIQFVVAGVDKWDAIRDGNKLTFTYEKTPGKKVEISQIKDIVDRTGEKETIKAVASLWGVFDFGLDNSILASGIDYDGNQSFVSVQTSLGNSTISINTGDTAEDLIDSLFLDLFDDGVDIRMTSSTTFDIFDFEIDPFISYQITDSNIFVNGGSGESFVPEPSTAILFVIGLLSFVGMTRKKPKHLSYIWEDNDNEGP